MDMQELGERKARLLEEILRGYGSVAVAFSGGVDSTLLLDVAHDVLGPNAIALMASSAFTPQSEADRVRAFCAEKGIYLVECPVDVLAVAPVAGNAPDRCYHCKRAIFSSLIEAARARGFSIVVDGTNLDDDGDYRPGRRALEELSVESPLHKAGFTKRDIRELSAKRGLSTAYLPSNACLATRFPYGSALSRSDLARADSMETSLRDLGLSPLRVRVHGSLARIEVSPEQMAQVVCQRKAILAACKDAGMLRVVLDLEGFRSGSMNEDLMHGEDNQ